MRFFTLESRCGVSICSAFGLTESSSDLMEFVSGSGLELQLKLELLESCFELFFEFFKGFLVGLEGLFVPFACFSFVVFSGH